MFENGKYVYQENDGLVGRVMMSEVRKRVPHCYIRWHAGYASWCAESTLRPAPEKALMGDRVKPEGLACGRLGCNIVITAGHLCGDCGRDV
jgi:hypothetical protein